MQRRDVVHHGGLGTAPRRRENGTVAQIWQDRVGGADLGAGEHDAIIDRATWERVHAILKESPRKRAMRTRAETPTLL